MSANITMMIPTPREWDRKHWKHDTNCSICGRPMTYRKATAALIVTTSDGTTTFGPIAERLGQEPAEWATAIGPACAKQLPKEYRTTMERAGRLFLERDES